MKHFPKITITPTISKTLPISTLMSESVHTAPSNHLIFNTY